MSFIFWGEQHGDGGEMPILVAGNWFGWPRVDCDGGKHGNCLSLALTRVVLQWVAQHVQMAGFLAIIATYDATQDYFWFTMRGLSNRTDVAFVTKDEKWGSTVEKKTSSNESLKKNHSIGLTPDKNLGISWFLSSSQHGRIRGMAVFSGHIWQSKNTLQLEGRKKSEFQYLHVEIEAFGVLLDFYYTSYYIYYCIYT